jgi:cytochrome c553
MARLIIFVVFLLCLGYSLSLLSFKEITPDNKPFDIAVAEKNYKAFQEEIAKKEEVEEVATEVKEEKPVFKVVLDTPELVLAEKLYSKNCVTCHGKQGQGKKSQKAPRIASQHEWYLSEQLILMKRGIRVNEKMNPQLKKLSEEELKYIATYLSKFPDWK